MIKIVVWCLMSAMVMTSALGQEQEQRGGSAQLPSRSLTRAQSGLESSASHGNLQEALLAQIAQLKPSDDADLEADFGTGTGQSSFAESLTDAQKRDHSLDFDAEAFHSKILIPSETTVAVKKISSATQKKITSDIVLLEPTLQKFFATVPSEIRGLQSLFVKKHLIALLQEKYRTISKQDLSEEIQKIQEQQKKGCCVIL